MRVTLTYVGDGEWCGTGGPSTASDPDQSWRAWTLFDEHGRPVVIVDGPQLSLKEAWLLANEKCEQALATLAQQQQRSAAGKAGAAARKTEIKAKQLGDRIRTLKDTFSNDSEGRAIQRIAERLHITEKTVRRHLKKP